MNLDPFHLGGELHFSCFSGKRPPPRRLATEGVLIDSADRTALRTEQAL